MKARDYFPLGIATGSAFCNRVEETRILLSNIENGKHTLLMAARRYGKSSLATHVIDLSSLPAVDVDFYMARDEKVIERYIINAVIKLIGEAIGPIDKFVTVIKKNLKHLKPKLDIATKHVRLELSASNRTDPATNIQEALLLLERLLQIKKQRAIMLLDEFQNVGVIAKGIGIEGSIRHVAQKTKYLSFIFSGSNRKLLETMFEDETRPLYKLCWKLSLNRIEAKHYQPHIIKAAKKEWGEEVKTAVIDKIYLLTERHPYYVNKLCDYIWTVSTKLPTKKHVEYCWEKILEEEKSDSVKEITKLPAGQKNVLLQIARGYTRDLMSKESMLHMKMTSSSVITALNALETKDLIERKAGATRIINPVIRYYVAKNE